MGFTAIFITVTAFLLAVYIVLICIYLYWFSKLKTFMPGNVAPATTFSIIIPARNEEDNIGHCLQSILNNNYPKHLYEVIVIDDFSTDATPAIVKQYQAVNSNIVLIQLKDVIQQQINSYKKRAIEIAVQRSRHNWIVTTDADCAVTEHWLNLFNAYINDNNPVFIAAPVMFYNRKTLVSVFQCLDFISLQGITAASVSAGFHSMCNGANLAYSKNAFTAVNGFKGVDNIASGDDMLLMHKIKLQYPEQIGYIFNQQAIVQTEPMPDFKSFINQRIRWASKATSYTDKMIFAVLLLVYITNLLLFALIPLSFFNTGFFVACVLLMLIKALFELPFMYKAAGFFKLRPLLIWFIFMQPLHITYTVVSGWLGKFSTYKWKGRNVK